jgi:hypothetical protein
MQEPRAQRTLVKSPPELWAEVSDIDALARHLGEFGEIRITRLDPETTVAWEGDRACGTVALEPAGWGTKVTITAKLAEVAPEPVAVEPEPVVVEPEPVAVEPEPEPVVVEPEPEPVVVEPEPEPVAVEPEPAAVEPDEAAPEATAPPSEAPKEAAPEATAPPTEAPKEGFFARLFGRRRKVETAVAVEAEPVVVEPEPESVAVEPEPEPVVVEPEPLAIEPEPAPQAPVLDAERAEAILTGVLDDLGSAHHRPFSRS